MFLFILSFLMIFISSYLFSSMAEHYSPIKTKPFLSYLLLFAFSEIILSFEILSLFKGISEINCLAVNFLFLLSSVVLLRVKNIPVFVPDLKGFFSDINKAVKRDKTLIIGLVALSFFILLAFIISLISPVAISDAMVYHVPRAVSWVYQGSLEHFSTIDPRMLSMPINSELFFAWVILFLKSDVALGMLPYFGYINLITVLYCFLGELGFCVRKRLWTVFIASAFAFIVIETTSLDTNMFVGSLLLTAIYLFYAGVKHNKNLLLFISSLALALDCGVKTTAIIALPSVALIMLYLSFIYNKKNFYKPILKFSLFFFLNFIVFSAYNYILNYIHFNDFVTTSAQYEINRFRGGIKGYLSNLIKYFFMIVADFSGINFMGVFNEFARQLCEICHLLIGVHTDTFTSMQFPDTDIIKTNIFLLETKVGMGILGILAFFPSLIISFRRFKKKSRNNKSLIGVIGLAYIFNILLFAGVMIYTGYNSRYLTTFAVMSMPVLVFTYLKSYKNVYKWLLIVVASYYLIFVSQLSPYRDVKKMFNAFRETPNIHILRDKMRSSVLTYSGDELNFCRLRKYLVQTKPKRTAYFSNYGDYIVPVDLLRLYGYKIDFLDFEDLKGINLRDYDAIIVHTLHQISPYIKKFNSKENSAVLPSGLKIYFDRENGVGCFYQNYRYSPINIDSDAIPTLVKCQTPIEQLDELGYYIDAFIPSNKYYDLIPEAERKKDNADLIVYRRR
ncbi:hypothetical protein IKQ26_09865 [bacterium]|nr:hypothetical protein [bacterium]